MIHEFHFLRPWCLLFLIPLFIVFWRWQRFNPQLQSWSAICDDALLKYLVHYSGEKKRNWSLIMLFISFFWVVFSMAGPAWSKYPVPSYAPILPHVVVMDMSEEMLARDLSPDRLTRAKFKLRDLIRDMHVGQLGLVVFTGEPFVVSPLTDDAKTIDVLLDSLSPNIMPVSGYRLDLALQEAEKLIQQSGYSQGQILVLTAETPNAAAVGIAAKLAKKGINTSVLPVRAKESADNALFKQLVTAGGGKLLVFSDNADELAVWLKQENINHHRYFSQREAIPVWRDEGRWFLIPALIFMLPVFRRGWLQRVVI